MKPAAWEWSFKSKDEKSVTANNCLALIQDVNDTSGSVLVLYFCVISRILHAPHENYIYNVILQHAVFYEICIRDFCERPYGLISKLDGCWWSHPQEGSLLPSRTAPRGPAIAKSSFNLFQKILIYHFKINQIKNKAPLKIKIIPPSDE